MTPWSVRNVEHVLDGLCTGGKNAFTQQAHGEFIVSFETKCPPNTQQAHGKYF